MVCGRQSRHDRLGVCRRVRPEASLADDVDDGDGEWRVAVPNRPSNTQPVLVIRKIDAGTRSVQKKAVPAFRLSRSTMAAARPTRRSPDRRTGT